MINKAWIDNHTTWIIEAVLVLVILITVTIVVLRRRKPKQLSTDQFHQKWQEVQALCASKETWPLAVINADALLDEALKKMKYKGKTMGERLVSAQRDLPNNDSIWFAHKLRNKLVNDEFKKLKKKDVMDVLVGIRGALRKLGALNPAEVKPTTEATQPAAVVAQSDPAKPVTTPKASKPKSVKKVKQ